MKKRKVVDRHYQLTEYEYAILKDLVKKSGSSREVDVIRDLILGSEIIEKPGREFYEAVEQIRKVGVNINQIAHMANATGVVDAECYKKDAEMFKCLAAEVKRTVMTPRLRTDAKRLTGFLQYAIFETEEEDLLCEKIISELNILFKKGGGADGNDKDMAD